MPRHAQTSRGMRKHIRNQKAEQRREKDKLLAPKQNRPQKVLPSFYSFHRRVEGNGRVWRCPNCGNILFENTKLIKLQTAEGPRDIYLHTLCGKKFRH